MRDDGSRYLSEMLRHNKVSPYNSTYLFQLLHLFSLDAYNTQSQRQ